jgi:hypothetical protein
MSNQFDPYLDAIQRFLHIFRFERTLYLIGGSVSFLVGTYAAIDVVRKGCSQSTTNAFQMIASSGGFMFTAGGFLLVFNKVFKLFKDLFEHQLSNKP